ncbi:MAG: flavodoxin domain-containing protein [Bacillota bacterium]|jgi:menaquinone-dependent protoporphyrinogen oxidase|nr:flavodoxin domain-containing protein [Bacillota bacterium]NLU54168.1 hypothetical protein [Bacillota bacterium]HOA90397.1 flavodoxin domain-containing protein [Bacillota bacterium]HOJ47053.1 flavodoxin domain-containing protein [Bacillota bacterium]HOL13911.1 flavodoxin domain-containing protein [Bacillota bacterium]
MQLVVYSSKHGSTKRCAEMLAEMLQADLLNAAEGLEVSLDKYDVVVLGSPVYVGQLLKPMKRFLEEHRTALQEKKLGLFVLCGFEERAMEIMEQTFPKELTSIAACKGYFGYSYTNLPFFERLLCRMIGADVGTEKLLTEEIAAFAEKLKQEAVR